jgi:hypothetical protein
MCRLYLYCSDVGNTVLLTPTKPAGLPPPCCRHSHRPWLLAVGGGDEVLRVYDRRFVRSGGMGSAGLARGLQVRAGVL